MLSTCVSSCAAQSNVTKEEMHPLLILQMRKPRVEMAKQFVRGCMEPELGSQAWSLTPNPVLWSISHYDPQMRLNKKQQNVL